MIELTRKDQVQAALLRDDCRHALLVPDQAERMQLINKIASDHASTVFEVNNVTRSLQHEQHEPVKVPWTRLENALDSSFDRMMLVEGFLENGRVYQWFGEAKKGKSLVVQDLACHLALGRNWAGRRTVKTLVLWVAGESVEDIKRRFAAWCSFHEWKGPMNFLMREQPVFLDLASHAEMLASDINDLMNANQGMPVLLVIDSVARNLSPGADENGAGLASFANNIIDRVIRPTGCSSILIHHSGHGTQSRGRGWSGFPAATDGTVMVSMDRKGLAPSIVKVEVTQSRSGVGGNPLQFELAIQPIQGSDNFGNQMAEPVLEFQNFSESDIKQPSGKNQKLILNVLHEMQKTRNVNRVLKTDLSNDLIENHRMAKSSFHDAWRTLLTGFYVIEDGAYVKLSKESTESPAPL